MEIKNLFLFFGIALVVLALVVALVGLRRENFPDRKTMVGLLVVALAFVLGTAVFAVKLSVEEAEERDAHSKEVIGEEASVTPLRVTPTV